MARIVLALIIVTTPVLYAASIPVRTELDLCGKWQAAVDPNNTGEGLRWYDPSVELPYPADVNVPGSFANIASKYVAYEGPGWFRRTFDVPADFEGKRVVIRFEAVNNQSKVWINGQLAGENPDAFLPFELDISKLLNYGQTNSIAVRADTTRLKNTVPGSTIGWHEFGGIIREVNLIAADPFHIESIQLETPIVDGVQKLTIIGSCRNGRSIPVQSSLNFHLLRPDGTEWKTYSLALPSLGAGHTSFFNSKPIIESPQLWSPENPALYSVNVSLQADGKVVDEKTVCFGFRTIEARNARLYLNGKPIFLTGFDRHEDSPRTDMCPDHEFTRSELLKMKTEFGANFIRLCHYPQHPKTLDICDELGLLVMCEIPLYMWQGIKESGDDYHKVYETAARQLEKMISRDYNHPSVIMWSVSNETWPQYLEVVGANTKLVAHVKRLDPTRLALHVSDHWRDDLPDGRSRQDHFGEDDVIGINGYPHRIFRKDGRILTFWHDDVRGATLDPNLITAFWSHGLDMLHAEYPNKPILITEYGWRSDEGHRSQAQFIAAGAPGMKKPWCCGATIWCWADHPWASESELRLSPYGIYTRERKPKPSAVEATKQAFKELRAYFQELCADSAAP